MISLFADDDDSNSDDDEELDLFGEMTEEEKEAKAKKDAVSPWGLALTECTPDLKHWAFAAAQESSTFLVEVTLRLTHQANLSCRLLKLPRNVGKRRLS